MPQTKDSKKVFAIVAGEASGDLLGASLIRELKAIYPDARFEGIGGKEMIAEGFDSLFDIERLSVMGFVEPLKRLPELLAIRRTLREKYIETPPDVFIGIDAPDFNFSLERELKKKRILTVHYVGPSVWAWRKGRVKTVAKSAHLLLTLFPFEADYYTTQDVSVVCVGHPLADQIPVEIPAVSISNTRQALLPDDSFHNAKLVALLPGSRESEVSHLMPVFLEAARLIKAELNDAVFLVPAANEQRYEQLELLMQQYSDLNIHLFRGSSSEVLTASDLVLIASGTATLQAMLFKKPMAIAYRMNQWSYQLLKRLVTTQWIGLPNLLAQKSLVPEFIQENVQAPLLAQAILTLDDNQNARSEMIASFNKIHQDLKKDAGKIAAAAITELIEAKGVS